MSVGSVVQGVSWRGGSVVKGVSCPVTKLTNNIQHKPFFTFAFLVLISRLALEMHKNDEKHKKNLKKSRKGEFVTFPGRICVFISSAAPCTT